MTRHFRFGAVAALFFVVIGGSCQDCYAQTLQEQLESWYEKLAEDKALYDAVTEEIDSVDFLMNLAAAGQLAAALSNPDDPNDDAAAAAMADAEGEGEWPTDPCGNPIPLSDMTDAQLMEYAESANTIPCIEQALYAQYMDEDNAEIASILWEINNGPPDCPH